MRYGRLLVVLLDAFEVLGGVYANDFFESGAEGIAVVKTRFYAYRFQLFLFPFFIEDFQPAMVYPVVIDKIVEMHSVMLVDNGR